MSELCESLKIKSLLNLKNKIPFKLKYTLREMFMFKGIEALRL